MENRVFGYQHREFKELKKSQGKYREKLIVFRFHCRFKFEVKNFMVVTRVIEHIFICKKKQGKIVNTGK